MYWLVLGSQYGQRAVARTILLIITPNTISVINFGPWSYIYMNWIVLQIVHNMLFSVWGHLAKCKSETMDVGRPQSG